MLLWDMLKDIKKGKYLKKTTDAKPTGTKEEEAKLRQLRVNLETARRQGDQQDVKEIAEEIKVLEEEIKRKTTRDAEANAEKLFAKYVSEVENLLEKRIPYADASRLVRENISTVKRYWRDNELPEQCVGILIKWYEKYD